MRIEQYHRLSSLIARYIVAANRLEGIDSDSETLRKNILHDIGVGEIAISLKDAKLPTIPEDTRGGRLGLEIELDSITVDTESRQSLAFTRYIAEKLLNPTYPDLVLSTDDNEGRSIIEIITGPKPLSDYMDESSALFRATNTLVKVLANLPKSGYTVDDITREYNNKLLGNNPTDDLEKYRLRTNSKMNPEVSLPPELKGKPLPYHVQVNIGVDLSGIGDVTSYIATLIAPRRSDLLRQVFQWSQYMASDVSKRLGLNSDLLKSMFTAHLYKQALDSSTREFERDKQGIKGSPVTQLEGLLKLGTADFLMTVISDLDAAQLKSAIRDYSWQAFASLMQETVNELARVGSETEGTGRQWTAPEKRLQARLESLFINTLDYRIEHGRMPLPLSNYYDCTELPQGKNKEPKFVYIDAPGTLRQPVTRHNSGVDGVRYLGTLEVREPWPALKKMGFAPPNPSTTAVIKFVQNRSLLGADPDIDGIFFIRARSLLTSDIGTRDYRDWAKQSILDRLGQLSQAKLEHVTRSFLDYQEAVKGSAGQDTLGRLLLTANLRAMTGGRSESSWDTLAQLQKIVSVDFNLQRVPSRDHQLPATITDSEALLVARWQQLARFNLPASLYRLLYLFSGAEDFIKAVLESGKAVSGNGMSLGRLCREIIIILTSERYLYQSHLDSGPLTLTVGIKDASFDNREAIAIGKLFATALLNHPEVAALGQTQRELRAIWGLSAITTGRSYGLTTELVLATIPKQKAPLYTQFLNGVGSINHNWQFAPGSVGDFARVLYWLSAQHDQQRLKEAFERVRNYHRQHLKVSLDTFASALVKTHRNLPDERAGLVLRQAIGKEGCTYLQQALTDKKASLTAGLNTMIWVGTIDRFYDDRDSFDDTTAFEIDRKISVKLSRAYFRYGGTEYLLLVDSLQDFLATPLGKDYLKRIGNDPAAASQYQILTVDAPKAVAGKQQIVVSFSRTGKRVVINPDAAASQKTRLSSLIPVFTALVKSGYELNGGSQPAPLDVKEIEKRVRQQMGLAPLVQLANIENLTPKEDSASDRIVLEKTYTIDKPAIPERLLARSPTVVNDSPLFTLKWLDTDSQQGLQLITAPLSLDELSRHRPLLDAAFQALDKTISTLSGPVKNRDLVWTFHEQLANTETVKRNDTLGWLIFEKITYTVHRPTGSHTLMYQSPIKIGDTPLTTLKWLGPGLHPGLQLVTPPLSLSHQTTNKDKLEATFYAVDKIISTQPQPLSDQRFHLDFDRYFEFRLPPFVEDPKTIWQTKITGKADTGIILRLASENLDKTLAPALFAVTDGPEGERLLASLQAASRFLDAVAPASGGNEATHAQLRSLFTLLLFRLSSDDLTGKTLFPGVRLADWVHTYLSDSAVTTLSHYINRVGLQPFTDDLAAKLTDLARQLAGTPDPQAGARIKDLLGTALDYRLANGAGLLPGTLPDTYSLPLADGGKYRALWTGLMSEHGTTRRVSRNADGYYLLDAALPLESSSMELLYQSDTLTPPLKLALKPDSLGRDQEVTRAFLEMAMSGVDTANWPWFSRRFSSLPELRRFFVVEALDQYRSTNPEADVRRLARAFTNIQLGIINEQIIQGNNPETPAMFRIKSLESFSGESTLTTEDGSKVHFHAGSLLPVTHKKVPSPDPQPMLLMGSHSSQFPGSFLDTRHSSRLYRQALQDGQLAANRFRDDVGRLIKIFSPGPESYRQRLQQQQPLDLSAGRPVHWRLNPHIHLQESRLQVGDTVVIVELGMKENPPLTLESFDTVVDRFYALALAKSVEAVDAALFQSGWPKEAGQLARLGDAIGFDSAQQWVSLPALRNRANTLYSLLADNKREAIEGQFGPPASQEDFRQAMIRLFFRESELLSLSFDRVSDYIQTHRDDPDIETFARALHEFDQKLSNDDRDLFRATLTHQQVELLKDVLTQQAPHHWELINFIGTLKTTVNSQAPVTDAAGYGPSPYRLVHSESGLKVVVIKGPDASGQKRCRRGVGGCGTRLLLAGNLADRPLLDIDKKDISNTDTGKPYYPVEFLTYKGELHKVLSRSDSDITATPLGDEVSLHDSIHDSDGSRFERVIPATGVTTTSVAVRRSSGEVYQLSSKDDDHYRAIRLQTSDRLLAAYDSSGKTLIPVLEKNDHGQTVYGLKLDNAASDTNGLFKLNPAEPLEDQLAAARRENHRLSADSSELRTLTGTDDRIAVILTADYRPGQSLANQAERLLSELRVFIASSAGQRLVNALGFPDSFIKPASMTELDTKLLSGMKPPNPLRLVIRLDKQALADRVIPYRPGGSGDTSGNRLVVLQVDPAVLAGQRHSTSNYLGALASVLKDFCRAALASTDQANSPAIAMTWLQGKKITGTRTLLQLENQLRKQFDLLTVQTKASAPAPVQVVTAAGGITTVKTGQQVRIAYKAIAEPLSGFDQLVGDRETRLLFQRVQYFCNQRVDQLPDAGRSRLGNLRSLLTQVTWSALVSEGMVTSQLALLADPADVVMAILDAKELKALAGIDDLAGHLEDVLSDALKDRRGSTLTATKRQSLLTWLSRAESVLTDAKAVRDQWTGPGQLPLGEDSYDNVPVTAGSRKNLALTSTGRQKVSQLGDQHLIAIESRNGPLSAPAGDELTGLLALLRQESPDNPQVVAALRTQLQWVPTSDSDYYRDAIERTLSPLSRPQANNLDDTLVDLFKKSSLTGAEPLLAEYFFNRRLNRRLKDLKTTDPARLRTNALRANEWLDLLQKNPPLPPGPGWEPPAFTLDTGLGRHQAKVQTTDGQKTFTLGRRDDLAFSDQGPGYALIHSEDHRKVFRVELPDRWPDRLLQIRLVVHIEPYRRLERKGRIGREQLQNDIQLIARGMGESRLSNLLQALVQPVRDAGIANDGPFKIRISPRPDWPLVDSRVKVNEENSAQVLLLLGTKDKNRPFIFRETLMDLVGASLLKALEGDDESLSAMRQQVRQQFGISTGTVPDHEPRPLGLTRQYALTPVADNPSGTSLYRQLVEGYHNLLLAEGTEADYRRAVAYLELHDKARIQAIKDSLSKGEIKVSDSERTLFNKVVNDKQSSAPLIPDPDVDNNIASYSPLPSTSKLVDADYQAFWTVGSGMESLLDPNLLGLSRAAAANFLSYRAKVIYEDYGLRLVISDYLKSLVVHFIYWKMDQVLGSNGQPASQIHLGVTDAVTAILPDSDIKVINNLNLPPIGSGASMVAALEKACAFVARGLGWERFDTGLLANMNEDVHTVFQKAVKLRQQVGRSFQLPVHPQQDVQRSVQALPWQPETIETIASSPRHGVMADGDRRYLKITPAGPGNPFPLMSPQSQDGLKRLLRQPLKPGENAATTEAYLSQLARHYETFRELKDIDMTGQVNAVIDKMDDVTRQRFADSFLHYARQSAIPAGLAETIAGKLLVAEISALGSLPEKISTGLYQRLNGLLNLTGKRTFSLTSGNLTMRVLTDPSITADASYLMPAQRTLVLGNGAADSPLTAAAALALLQAVQAQKPEDQTKTFLALQQKRIKLPEGMDKLSPESLVSEFTVKEGKLTLSGLVERLTSFIGMAHRLNREGSSESRLLAGEIRQNVADSLTALRSDIDFGQMAGIVDMTESHFRQALQKLDKAGLPAGQATRLPDADCVLCNGSGPVRTAMDLMDRISGHLDAIEVSDRFNHIRQTAGDKGLLADAFLLLEQGRFAAVATEDIQDSPVFRKKFLDLFRQTLTEQQGLTPEQVIDRVVSSLNDSGYSADDTRYVKEQLLKNQAFMEGLKTRKDHPGGSGFDANGPGGGSKKRPGKVTRMLDKLDRSKTYGRIKVGVGAGQSIVGLASGIQAIENLKKYGHILPDETRNLAYAGAGLEIGNSVYGLAMTSHWLVSSGKRLIKGSDAAGSGLKTLKTTTRAAKASRVVTRMVPVGGSFIGIAGAVVSITSNEMSARDARASGNDAQATYYEMMIALDAISIALDLVGMVLDFFPPFGVIADLVGQLLTVIQTVIAAFMPPNNARQEFDAIVQGDGFARYMDNMAKDFEKKGFSRFEYHTDATEFLHQSQYEDNLEELSVTQKRSLAGTTKGLAFTDRVNRRRTKMGSNLEDYMRGEKGYKIFYGLGGDDTLIIDEGELYGGSGNDRLTLEKGLAEGGDGNDVIRIIKSGTAFGDSGDDDIWIGESGVAYGGRGNDILRLPYNDGLGYGGPGRDTIINGRIQYGGPDDDYLIDDLGYIKQFGGSGNDRLEPGLGKGILYGGPGNDTLILPSEIKIPYLRHSLFYSIKPKTHYYRLNWTKSDTLFEVNLQTWHWGNLFPEYLKKHGVNRDAPDGKEIGDESSLSGRFGLDGYQSGFSANPRDGMEQNLRPGRMYIAELSSIKADYHRATRDKQLPSEYLLTGYDAKRTKVERISDHYGLQTYFYVGRVKSKHVHYEHEKINIGPTKLGHMYISERGAYLLQTHGDLYYFSKTGLRERGERPRPNDPSIFYATVIQLLATGGSIANVENVVGSTQGVSVTGTAQPNNIYLWGGKNEVHTGGGNDFVSASNGNGTNWIALGPGNDQALLGNGLNRVHGGPGTDTVSYLGRKKGLKLDLANRFKSEGEQLIEVEVIQGSPGNDVLWGDHGNNLFIVTNGTNTVDLRGGNDTVVAIGGSTSIRLRSGFNTVVLGDGKVQGSHEVYTGTHTDTIMLRPGSHLGHHRIHVHKCQVPPTGKWPVLVIRWGFFDHGCSDHQIASLTINPFDESLNLAVDPSMPHKHMKLDFHTPGLSGLEVHANTSIYWEEVTGKNASLSMTETLTSLRNTTLWGFVRLDKANCWVRKRVDDYRFSTEAMLALLNRYPEKPLGEFPRQQWRKKTRLQRLANEGEKLGAGLHRIGSQESHHINLVIEFGFVSGRCTPQNGSLRKLTLGLGQQQLLFEGAAPSIKKHGVSLLRPRHTLGLKLVKTHADGRRKQQGRQTSLAMKQMSKWTESEQWSDLFPGQPMAKTLAMLELNYGFDTYFRDQCRASPSYNSSLILPAVHLDLSSDSYSGIPIILGSPGNDQLTGNPSTDNVLIGMGGHDRLKDMGGNNQFIVGMGNTTVIAGKEGYNQLVHDERLSVIYGTRLLQKRSRSLGVKVITSTYQLDGIDVNVTEGIAQTRWQNTDGTGHWRYHQTVFSGIDQMAGTSGNDTYFGSNGTDIFSTGGGFDKVDMGDGDDRLIVNAPWQRGTSLDGGSGANTLLFNLPVSRAVTVGLKNSLTVRNFILEDTGKGSINFFGDDKDNVYMSRGSLRRFHGRGGDDTLLLLKLPTPFHFNGGPGKDTLDLSRAILAPEFVRLHLSVVPGSVRRSCPAKDSRPCSEEINIQARLFYTLRRPGSRSIRNTWSLSVSNFEVFKGPDSSDIFSIPALAGLAVDGGGGDDIFRISSPRIKGNSSITTTVGGAGYNRHYGSPKADRMVANLGPDLLSGDLGPDIYVIYPQANGTQIVDRDNGNTLVLHGVQPEKLEWRLTGNYTRLDVNDAGHLFFSIHLQHVPHCERKDGSLVTGHFINSLERHIWRLTTIAPGNNGTRLLSGKKLRNYYYSRLTVDKRLDGTYRLGNITAPVHGGPGDDVFFISGTVKPGAGLFGDSGNDIFHLKSSGASVHPGSGNNLVSLELENSKENGRENSAVKLFFAPSSFNRIRMAGVSLADVQAASWRSLEQRNATDSSDQEQVPCPAGLSRLMPPPVTGGRFFLAAWIRRGLPLGWGTRAGSTLVHFADAGGSDAISLSLKSGGLEIRLTEGFRVFHRRVRQFFSSPRQHLAMTINDSGFLTIYRNGQIALATQAFKPIRKIRALNCYAVEKLVISQHLPSPDGIKMMASGVKHLVRIGTWRHPYLVYANDWPDSLELDDGILDDRQFIGQRLESGYSLLQKKILRHQYLIDKESVTYYFSGDDFSNSDQWVLANATGTADQLEINTHDCQTLQYQKSGRDLILTVLPNDSLLKNSENSPEPDSTQSLRVENFFSREGETVERLIVNNRVLSMGEVLAQVSMTFTTEAPDNSTRGQEPGTSVPQAQWPSENARPRGRRSLNESGALAASDSDSGDDGALTFLNKIIRRGQQLMKYLCSLAGGEKDDVNTGEEDSGQPVLAILNDTELNQHYQRLAQEINALKGNRSGESLSYVPPESGRTMQNLTTPKTLATMGN
ncbi:calcium-binding protein [Endozoicomonas sp. 8E]|uniref:calcium-binding protein n=1 Tax=Endozoicomonas sp. 8E TaxID=3035692 RepID=UPI0029394B18|nr:calcium-binding protein [Endozoicomonas sp. 8E]WOG29810.1 calcium-binding protein [Endozoicomonas sp. 8E]